MSRLRAWSRGLLGQGPAFLILLRVRRVVQFWPGRQARRNVSVYGDEQTLMTYILYPETRSMKHGSKPLIL